MPNLKSETTAASQLQAELQQLRTVFNHMEDAVFLAPISENGMHCNFVEVNETACQRLGYTRDELLQLNARTINPKANLLKVKSFGRNILKEGVSTFEAIHQCKNGTAIPVEVTAKTINIGGKYFVLSVARDLRGIHQLETENARFGYIMDHMWDEIFIFSQADLGMVYVNHGARENLQYTKQQLLALRFIDLFEGLPEDEFKRATQCLLDGKENQVVFESKMLRQDQSSYAVEVRLQLSHNEVPPLFLANAQDISQRKLAEEKLAFLANYDSLTGLPNRNLFLDRLNMAMEQAKRTDMLIGVMFLDIDNFKTVNDTLGHQSGDELIVEVADRLSRCVRKTDTVSRLGGDEFTIILSNLNNVEDANIVAGNIREAILQPVQLKDKKVYIGISIGITFYPMDEQPDAFHLLKQSDTAMYQAKRAGKNRFCHYTATLKKTSDRRAQLESDIKEAFLEKQFILHYQPRVELIGKKIIGAESLIRWQHPEFGLIYPGEFISILEKNSLIDQVGLWVFRQSCKQLVQWQKIRPDMQISVNVSAKQLETEDIIMDMNDTLSAFAISPSLIELEVTEGVFLSSNPDTNRRLQQLNDLGLKISLDDFGSGYSSLNYLKNFPIDVIKIDRSFVQDLEHDTASSVITETIIQLAQRLKLGVIAEGIETASQATLLQEKGCTQGQGYYFSKPIASEDFRRLLSGESSNVLNFQKKPK